MISSHSAAVLVSHQSLAGASTLPVRSSGTKPCCCPDTPIATTRALIAGSIREKQARTASTHQSARCSRLPSSPAARSSGWPAVATMWRASGS
jgi:hypothetical protein